MKEIMVTTALATAKGLVGTREEHGPNRGRVVDEIEQEFGLLGVSYCVLFVLYCYKLPYYNFQIPFPFLKTPSSQSLFEWAKTKNLTYTDPKLIQTGDIVIWRKFKLWQGHAGIILSYDEENGQIKTIEGNTSNSDYGSQSDGDGIYRRIRGVSKLDFSLDGFYLRGFINVRKISDIT